jgi:hypothetical protein
VGVCLGCDFEEIRFFGEFIMEKCIIMPSTVIRNMSME